jgi:hypothetical protein
MRCTARLGLFLILIASLVRPAWAWSYKEHVLFTRLAVMRLLADPSTPPAMKAWLKDASDEIPDLASAENYFYARRVGINPSGFTGLSYWSYAPDIHALNDPAATKVAPFNVHERLLHFIDLELFLPGEVQRVYKHDLSNKPRPADISRDMKDERFIQAGMLPFRIEQCYRELIDSIRTGRLHAKEMSEQEGKTATYWAGYLAHYLADNTQPHHATIDYRSARYFAQGSRGPNVHAEVEYRMCDDENNDYMALRREFWPLFVRQLAELDDPIKTTDPWQASLEVSFISYDALPLIGLAAMHAAKQAGTPDKPEGRPSTFNTEDFFRFRGHCFGREMSMMEMKAIQTAWAVKRIEKTFRQAWDEATVAR